jgi:HEAT repeat protein
MTTDTDLQRVAGSPWKQRRALGALLMCSVLLLAIACAQEESPKELIRQFNSMSQAVRTRAGNALIRFDADQVVPLLIAASDHELVRVRFETTRMLGRFGDARGVPVLVAALDDKSPRVAAMAAASLTLLRAEEALPALLKYARDPSVEVRRYVIGALGACHCSTTQPALSDSAHTQVLRALAAADPDLRVAALQGIREFGYRDAVDLLLRMSEDASAVVRHVAVQALGELGMVAQGRAPRGQPRDPFVRSTPEQLEAMVTALLQRLGADENQSVRTKAIRALGDIRHERAVPALTRLQRDGTPDDHREVRRALNAISGSS